MPPFLEVLTNPQWQWAALAIFGTAILQVAAAVWAAGSRRHWFLRALVLWGAIALLVPIRAYEPALLFAISSPLTVAIVLAWQATANRWNPPRDPAGGQSTAAGSTTAGGPRSAIRFGLRDLFLLVTIVGLSLAVLVAAARNARVPDWAGPARHAAALVISGAAAYAVVFGQRRRFWAYATAAGATWGAVYLFWNSRDWMRLADVMGVGVLAPSSEQVAILTIAYIGVAATSSWIISILARMASTDGRAMVRISVRAGLVLLAGIVLPFWGLLYWHMLWLTPLPPEIVDEPNHYARILEIARELAASKQDEHSLADLRDASPDSDAPDRIERLYAELLPLLDAPNHVVLPPAVRDQTRTSSLSLSMDSITVVNSLSRSLRVEAIQAAAEGDLDRAVAYDLANVRFGAMFSRGGAGVDYLVGMACESIGAQHLAEIRRDLSTEQARQSISVLQHALAVHDTPELIQQRYIAYWERWEGWPLRLESVIATLVGVPPRNLEASANLCRLAERPRLAECRLLQTDLALRMFHRDTGTWPASLDELVPAYLPAVPLDSYSGEPLRYRPAGDDFVLYSVGQDRTDNGGRFGNTTEYFGAGGYDLDLDTYSRP